MTIIANCLSYTQSEAEKLMANNLLVSNEQVKFESNYGCGEFLENSFSSIIKWEEVKEIMLSEYDELWKELAKL